MYMLVLLTGWRGIELACPGNLRWVNLGAVGIAYLLLSVVILPLGMTVKFLLPGLVTATVIFGLSHLDNRVVFFRG
jgi:hypothetical protein